MLVGRFVRELETNLSIIRRPHPEAGDGDNDDDKEKQVSGDRLL